MRWTGWAYIHRRWRGRQGDVGRGLASNWCLLCTCWLSGWWGWCRGSDLGRGWKMKNGGWIMTVLTQAGQILNPPGGVRVVRALSSESDSVTHSANPRARTALASSATAARDTNATNSPLFSLHPHRSPHPLSSSSSLVLPPFLVHQLQVPTCLKPC